MCTAISFIGDRHLFGRTLDLECSYGESVVTTPRTFERSFAHEGKKRGTYAFIGVAHVSDGTPLYYDAMNEAGLCAAALNFPLSAVYGGCRVGYRNIASFELLPLVLGDCASVDEAKQLLRDVNVTSDAFSPSLPPTPLHWLIADRTGAIAVEPMEQGLRIIDDPARVLCNEPPLDYQLANLSSYMSLSPRQPHNHLCPDVPLPHYSRGMGALGLPGDLSSSSRFIRAVYAKTHTQASDCYIGEIARAFHVLDTVSQPLGCALTDEGKPISTVYTVCADTKDLIYYFTTYGCRRIRAVRFDDSARSGELLRVYPMQAHEDIAFLN